MPTAPLRYVRSTSEPVGLRVYLVRARGTDQLLGYAEQRRGGWWRATTITGEAAGSWHHTRAAAGAAIADRLDLTL